jgi:DNA-binding MarR family transcriptional regulator
MKLYQQLDLISRKLRQIEQKVDKQELSAAKLTVLQMIKRYNPSTLKELAQHQNVALPTMSKIVDELQKRALIIRAQSKEDARQRWIVPTQKGIQLLERAKSENDIFWQNKFAHLSKQQQQQLAESLNTLLDAL